MSFFSVFVDIVKYHFKKKMYREHNPFKEKGRGGGVRGGGEKGEEEEEEGKRKGRKDRKGREGRRRGRRGGGGEEEKEEDNKNKDEGLETDLQ